MADTRHLLADAAPEAAAALLIEQASNLVHHAGRILGSAHAKRAFKVTRGPNGTDVTPTKDARADVLQSLQIRANDLEAALDALVNDLTTEAEKHRCTH